MSLDDANTTVDGAALLDEIRAVIVAYVALPSPECADALALYVAATHAQASWEHASRLAVLSPQRRCGKTRLLEVLRELVYRALSTVNISAAALARSLDETDPPTLILDEADTVFATKRRGELTESADVLRGLLNSGHSRGWPYTRWDATARRLEECPTYAMAIIAGIGGLPDTIMDRAVVIRMRRRAQHEPVRQWRSRRAVPALREIRERLHVWVLSVADVLDKAEPDLPVTDRAADTWESLVAIADVAGGTWPDRAREACRVLAGAVEADEGDDPAELLLSDLAAVWKPADAERLSTADILTKLAELEESPWRTWHKGDPLSARSLAQMLRPYGVKSNQPRGGPHRGVRGYDLADLADVWARYAVQAPTRSIRSTRANDDEDALWPAGTLGTDDGTPTVPLSVPPHPRRSEHTSEADGTDGTDGTAERLNGGHEAPRGVWLAGGAQ